MRIWLVCCGSIRGLIILSLQTGHIVAHAVFAIVAQAFAPNGPYCRSCLKNEVCIFGLFIVAVSRRLIISFAPNGLYCRSRLKNEVVCIFGLFIVAVSRQLIISFAPNESYYRSRLKNEVYIFNLSVVAHAFSIVATGSPSSLYEPHKEHNMASNYKGLYGIFYKISVRVVKSENIQ